MRHSLVQNIQEYRGHLYVFGFKLGTCDGRHCEGRKLLIIVTCHVQHAQSGEWWGLASCGCLGCTGRVDDNYSGPSTPHAPLSAHAPPTQHEQREGASGAWGTGRMQEGLGPGGRPRGVLLCRCPSLFPLTHCTLSAKACLPEIKYI